MREVQGQVLGAMGPDPEDGKRGLVSALEGGNRVWDVWHRMQRTMGRHFGLGRLGMSEGVARVAERMGAVQRVTSEKPELVPTFQT